MFFLLSTYSILHEAPSTILLSLYSYYSIRIRIIEVQDDPEPKRLPTAPALKHLVLLDSVFEYDRFESVVSNRNGFGELDIVSLLSTMAQSVISACGWEA